MIEWGLSDSEQQELDSKLFVEHNKQQEAVTPEDWKHYIIAVPPDFYEILLSTIDGYKLLRETDKNFPALEAIVMEARNSLPQEILEQISKKEG